MKVTPRAASLIPKGTYVPSNLSPEEWDRQFVLNNPNTMASKGHFLESLGFEKEMAPTTPTSIDKTKR